MKRLLMFIASAIIFSMLFTACSSVVSPNDAVKSPSVTDKTSESKGNETDKSIFKDSVMDKYRELKNKNGSPAEIMKFARENIGNLNKEDADIVIKGLLEAQKQKLKNYQDKLYSDDFNTRINSCRLEDLKSLKADDADIKSFLEDAFGDGMKLFEAEGMKDLELDYETLNKDFSGYLSDELSGYIGIKAEFTRQHPFVDGAVVIDWDELAGRIIKMEDFLKKYTSSEYKEEIKGMHTQYLSIYMLGLDNTPAFDYSTKEIRPDVLKSFMTVREKYADSELAGILTEYMKLLKSYNNKKTSGVLQYVGKITGYPDYGTAE